MTRDNNTQDPHRRNQWSFEEAKRMFAGSGRIWDLVDGSLACDPRQHQEAVYDRIRHRRSFWVYEQDMTPIGSAVTRMGVTNTVTPTGLLTQAEFDPVSFSLHSLRRYWERNEEGHQLDDFKTIAISHLKPETHITAEGLIDYRLDHLVPYGQGAFVGTAVMKAQVRHTAQHNKITTKMAMQMGFNAITYLNCTQMNTFQLKQWHAAQTEPDLYQQLHDKNIQARSNTARAHIVKLDSL